MSAIRSPRKPQMTGDMTDHMRDVDSNKSIRTQENVHCVQQAYMQGPRKSVRCFSLNFGASPTHRII